MFSSGSRKSEGKRQDSLVGGSKWEGGMVSGGKWWEIRGLGLGIDGIVRGWCCLLICASATVSTSSIQPKICV